MHAKEVRLGLCFFNNRLFYAVNDPGKKAHLKHIGAIDFSFNVPHALFKYTGRHTAHLKEAVNRLKERFGFSHLQVLLHPQTECKTVLPKLVYDNAEEREAHINILMNGVKRNKIHTSWHSLSNEKFKLLKLQTDDSLRGPLAITEGQPNVHLLSTFEIGEHWISHARPGGSILTVCCYKNCVAVSSYILGKLRGTTHLPFDEIGDLPYFWLQQSKVYPWMKGLHEQIQVFGYQADKIIDLLQPFWDDAGAITKMDSLEKIDVTADEKTYSFDLASAYPVIMMALGK
ncbi:MAG TPA: hypothetical protein VK106_05290 [Balneolaceae bacterium]|nr:hypothetical protein [Balneolaceae bacterium]